MKNTTNYKTILRIVGFIAIVAIIGFSMTACGGDDGGISGTSGKLTITGYNEYNDKYVIAIANDYVLQKSFVAAAGISEDWTSFDAVKISDGKATLKVWEVQNNKGGYNAKSYNGNDSITFKFFVYDSTPIAFVNNAVDNSYIETKDIRAVFENGIATNEKYYPSVEAQLSDSRFNGTFNGGAITWIFNGTNKVKYTSRSGENSYDFDYEIKLENGHFWERLWNNEYSSWSDWGEYSFSNDGNTLKIGYNTYTKE